MASDVQQVVEYLRRRKEQIVASASTRPQSDAATNQPQPQHAGASAAAGAAGAAAAVVATDVSTAGAAEEASQEKKIIGPSIADVDKRRIGEWVDSKVGAWAYEKPTGKIRHIRHQDDPRIEENDDTSDEEDGCSIAVASVGDVGMCGPRFSIIIATDTEETKGKLSTLLTNARFMTGRPKNDYPEPTKEHPHVIKVSLYAWSRRGALSKLLSVVDKVEPIPLPIRERLWAAEFPDDFLYSVRVTIQHWLSQRTDAGFAQGEQPFDTAFDTAMKLAAYSGCLDMYYLIADTCNAAHLGEEAIWACEDAFEALKQGFQFVDQTLLQAMHFIYASNMLVYQLDEKGKSVTRSASEPYFFEKQLKGEALDRMLAWFKEIEAHGHRRWRDSIRSHYEQANAADVLKEPSVSQYIQSTANVVTRAAAATGAAAAKA